MHRSRTSVAAVAGLISMLALSACEGVPGHYPGGTLASIDKYVYPSTMELPQTVTLVDTRTGQTIWSKDIPVGQQLVMRFYADATDDPHNPDRLEWRVMKLGRTGGTLTERMSVPNAGSRRLDTSFRARGELPPETVASVPTADVAPVEAAPTQPVITETQPVSEPAPVEQPADATPPVDIPEMG